MNETAKRRILSVTCIVGFFVVWELLCLMFHVQDIVLPRPSQILKLSAISNCPQPAIFSRRNLVPPT